VDGREASHQPYGSATGTIIAVENLFAVMPARLKFLKQPATEAGLIQQIVTRYALAYPERRFNLVSDGRMLFQSTGSGKLFDVLMRVYGLDFAKQMLPVGNLTGGDTEAPERGIRVFGYTGFPELHRSNRSYITLFVNRRWFQDTSIAYSVIQAYHTLLPTGRYPVAVLFLEIDPAEVDVNVHRRRPSAIPGCGRGVRRSAARCARDADGARACATNPVRRPRHCRLGRACRMVCAP
jgi:DNA mismatch repair protein MutL